MKPTPFFMPLWAKIIVISASIFAILILALFIWVKTNPESFFKLLGNPDKTPSAETPKQTMHPETSQKTTQIIVHKASRKMDFFANDSLIFSTKIALGKNPQGHKVCEGDSRTPEGNYTISGKNPNSKYHLSLRISYPNETDIQNAQKLGKSAGGDIMIHGLPNENTGWEKIHESTDWTQGCIAVRDSEIEHIWQIVEIGTPIRILPD